MLAVLQGPKRDRHVPSSYCGVLEPSEAARAIPVVRQPTFGLGRIVAAYHERPSQRRVVTDRDVYCCEVIDSCGMQLVRLVHDGRLQGTVMRPLEGKDAPLSLTNSHHGRPQPAP
jgi:hypothetical protein